MTLKKFAKTDSFNDEYFLLFIYHQNNYCCQLKLNHSITFLRYPYYDINLNSIKTILSSLPFHIYEPSNQKIDSTTQGLKKS